MIAFAYYGAKNGLIKDLLPLLPESDHYVEPFCGSAAVLLNRKPMPIETINDLNGEIVNFFSVLRTSAQCLVDNLLLTPYSRQEFEQAWETSTDPVERARKFYIRTQSDIAKAGHKKDKSWSVNVKFSIGQHSSAVRNFASKIPGLLDVAERIKMVQIENRPAIDIIEKYDSPKTLFYCDPPYLPSTRKSANDYKFELNIEGHYSLSKTLNKISGLAAVSGYYSPIMDELYPGWNIIKFKPRKVPMSRGNGLVRQECLWCNYDPKIIFDKQHFQTRLFNQ